MNTLAIRQSGGANIISIPKAILNVLGLHVGSTLDLSIRNQSIVLTPVKEKLRLEDLLAETPQEALSLTAEDKEWLQDAPVGKEVL